MTPAIVVPVLGRSLYPGASVALDFTRNLYRSGTPVVKSSPSLLSGWTFTRASTGYAETAAGLLTSFASGSPRITDKGLLVEEARTNYALRSQEFDNAAYIKTNMAVTADDTVAPDGTQTADKVYVSSVAANTTIYQNVSPGAGTSIAVTLYAKKGTSATTVNEFGIRDVTGGVTLLVFTVNYDTLAVTYSTGASGVTVTQCANGWVRIQMLLSWTSGNTCRVYCGYASGTRTLNDYAYVWGLQVEVGAFPTSYIPTTTASATRAADQASITGLSLPAPVSTLFDVLGSAGVSTDGRITLSDGSGNNRMIAIAGATVQATQTGNNIGIGSTTAAYTAGTPMKIGISFDGTTALFSIDGTTRGGGAGTNFSGSLTRLDLANASFSSGRYWNNYIRRLVIYPAARPQATLNADTT